MDLNDQKELIQAIDALEAQREKLGDIVVNTSIAALRDKLEKLITDEGDVVQLRKLATVLFVDIVNSTEMGRKLDPEVEIEIVEEALKRLANPVQNHGGRVARYQGDGFKSVFGIPTGRENDAEEAVRAGLEMLHIAKKYALELKESKNIENFEIRVGIDTGMVVSGGASEGDDTIKGTPVNLGIRAESAAPPGGMLITHNTYGHISELFEFEESPSISAKGFVDPIKVYLVKEIKNTFWEQSEWIEGIKSPMVGREAELNKLMDAFYTTTDESEAQFITVIGSAGVGKSRLLKEFENWIYENQQKVNIFRGKGKQNREKLPFSLLRNIFSYHFNILENDSPKAINRKIENGFGEVFGEDKQGKIRAHFIGQLLGFDFSQSPNLQDILTDTHQIRDRALIYLGEYFQSIIKNSPIVFFLEDIQWGDDTSLDLIDFMARSNFDQKQLVICLARPTFLERRPYWGEGQGYQSQIDLQGLTKRESRQLIDGLLQKVDDIPTEFRELIVSGAEGNPYYIEELIKMLIEKAIILKSEEVWKIESAKLSELEVPSTLTGVLQARLDRLEENERFVLQIASVIGQEFWDLLINKIYLSDKESLEIEEIMNTLTILREKKLIFHRENSSFDNSQEYTFSNTILKEVTYESVLLRTRSKFHGIVADWLIDQLNERVGEFAGIIANHLALSDRGSESIPYLHMAGELAAKQYANSVALEYFERGINLISKGDNEIFYSLLLSREQVYSLMGNSLKQKEDLDILEIIGNKLKDDGKKAQVALLIAKYHRKISDYAMTIKMATKTIEFSKLSELQDLEASGYLIWGRALLSMGKYNEAKLKFEKAKGFYQSDKIHQIEVDSIRYLGVVESGLGNFTKAKEYWEKSLDLYQQIGDRRGEGWSLNHLGNLLLTQGEHKTGREYYDRFLAICHEIGDRWGESLVVSNIGEIHFNQANYNAAISHFEKAIELTQEVGNRTVKIEALVGLGNVQMNKSDYSKAFESFEASLKLSREIGNRPLEGNTLRQLGQFFHRLGDYFRAMRYYDQANHIYKDLGNRSSESRILAYLGALHSHMGDNKKGREYGEQSSEIANDIGHKEITGLAATQLGHSLSGLGLPDEAEKSFKRAITCYRELDKGNLVMDPLAGLGNLQMEAGDFSLAQETISEILEFIENQNSSGDQDSENFFQNKIVGTKDPMQIYFTCYQILKANKDARANEVLSIANLILQAQVAKIEDVELRHLFVHNIKINKEIISTSKMYEKAT